jgi:hypothetical protein
MVIVSSGRRLDQRASSAACGATNPHAEPSSRKRLDKGASDTSARRDLPAGPDCEPSVVRYGRGSPRLAGCARRLHYGPWPDVSGPAGEVVGDGVGGVAVKRVACAVVPSRSLGVSLTREVLQVSQGYAGVESACLGRGRASQPASPGHSHHCC